MSDADRRKVKDSLVECLITASSVEDEDGGFGKDKSNDSVLKSPLTAYNGRGDSIKLIMTRNSGKMSCFETLYAMEKGSHNVKWKAETKRSTTGETEEVYVPLSLQEGYSVLSSPNLLARNGKRYKASSQYYTVYQYLRNRGFHVFEGEDTLSVEHARSIARSRVNAQSSPAPSLFKSSITATARYFWSFCSWIYTSVSFFIPFFSFPSSSTKLHWPLTSLNRHRSSASVLESIQLIKEVSPFSEERNASVLHFDVYKPASAKFKKKSRGNAHFQVLVFGADEGITFDKICGNGFDQSDNQNDPLSTGTAIKVAIVTGKSISFLSLYE